jgi:hypothetical protein
MNKLIVNFILVMLLTTITVASQGPILEYSMAVGSVPFVGGVLALRSQVAAADVNGDGKADMITFSKQEKKLIVRSGNSSQIWEYPVGNFVFQKIEWAFLGFFEMNNDSPEKEALFAHKVGRSLNQVTVVNQMAAMNMQFLANQLLTDIVDIDDDGIEELQLFNKDTGFLEIWGPGPKLELFPANFSLENFTMIIDTTGIDTILVVNYLTQVNGEKRNVEYTFLQNQTVDISIKDGSSNTLLFYNSTDNFEIPDGADESAAWLLTQNLIVNSSVGLIPIWVEFKDLFSDEAEAYASNGLAGIGGIIGAIPGLVDMFCRSGGSATCSDDFGTVTIECDCGVPSCVTQQVAVTVRIVEVDANTGQRTEREEIQYKEKCVCTCMKLKDTQS